MIKTATWTLWLLVLHREYVGPEASCERKERQQFQRDVFSSKAAYAAEFIVGTAAGGGLPMSTSCSPVRVDRRNDDEEPQPKGHPKETTR
jgi:hypothetical protein